MSQAVAIGGGEPDWRPLSLTKNTSEGVNIVAWVRSFVDRLAHHLGNPAAGTVKEMAL